jgi:type II secretory pathway pseudopilin PulG
MNRFHRTQAAFSLAEVIVACGLLAIAAAASVQALLRMNHNASLSRLQTGASTVAQNRIDQILSDGPFNPQKSQVPPVLVIGTDAIGSATSPTVPIYTDPATGVVTVWGWMTSTIADASTNFNGQSLKIYRATVEVDYTFRGRPYSVTMSTLRTSDI